METIQTIYQAVMYVRLSKDDGDINTLSGKSESDSITNQKTLIREYIKFKSDINLCAEYVDDGYSGVSFERPAFLSMLEDIKSGKYNCVIVKDLSRFGRDYIQAGRYIEKIFPVLGVRFIAINDNFDSMNTEERSNRIYVPFRNFMNDSYCRDTSIKIRSHLDAKRKQGEFIGSFAVYGYLKAEDNRNKLIVDEYAATVVKEIFDLKLQGYSQGRIADQLNEMGELSPMEYKKSMGFHYHTSFKKKEKAKWTAVAVGRILKNEIYTGVLLQGKRTTPNHKIKTTIVKPKEQWIRVEQTHSPIITKECFETVQNLLKKDLRVAPGCKEVYLFSGLLECEACGESLIRKINRYNEKVYVYYICTSKRNGGDCKGCRINEQLLSEVIFSTLKKQIEAIVEMERLFKNINIPALNKVKIEQLKEKAALLEEELQKCKKLKVSLYENLTKQIINREDYEIYGKAYQNRQIELEEALQLRLQEIKELTESTGEESHWIKKFKEYGNIDTLNRKTLVKLVEKIVVRKDNHIEVILKYKDEFEVFIQSGGEKNDRIS